MENVLYLLLPIIDSDNPYDEEYAYLKSLDKVPTDFLQEVFATLLHLYTHEEFTTFYDKRRLSALLKAAKEINGGKFTEAHKLLDYLLKKDFTEYSPEYMPSNTIHVNNTPVTQGILNAYIESATENDTLVDPTCLRCEPKHLRIIDNNSNEKQAICINCERRTLHNWFIINRVPRRKLDTNYDKHQTEERKGKHGVISALTYDINDVEVLMHQAIKSDKNLYLKDKNKEKLIIFWSENLERPTYHAYEVSIHNKAEIDKIFKKGGRDLYNLVDTYSI